MKTIIDAYWADLFWSTEGRKRQSRFPPSNKARCPDFSLATHPNSSFLESGSSPRFDSAGICDRRDLPSSLIDFPGPMNLLLLDPNQRNDRKDLRVHIWTQHLPFKALAPIGNNCFVVSPEFLLLESANRISLGELIALGHEFCGSYAIDARTGAATFGLEPITSVEKLEHFIVGMGKTRGIEKLRRALPHIHEGSASPMETALAARLCMPSRMGGYQLPKVEMNARVDLSDAAKKVYKHKYCRCDLLFPKAQLDLEYNGKEFHLAKQEDDAARQGALDIMGMRQKTMTARQYKDFAAFGEIARDIAKLHGSYLRRDQVLPSKARITLFAQLEAYLSNGNRQTAWE